MSAPLRQSLDYFRAMDEIVTINQGHAVIDQLSAGTNQPDSIMVRVLSGVQQLEIGKSAAKIEKLNVARAKRTIAIVDQVAHGLAGIGCMERRLVRVMAKSPMIGKSARDLSLNQSGR